MRNSTVKRVRDALLDGRSFTRKQIENWFGAKNPTRVIHYLRNSGMDIDTYRNAPRLKTRYAYSYAF